MFKKDSSPKKIFKRLSDNVINLKTESDDEDSFNMSDGEKSNPRLDKMNNEIKNSFNSNRESDEDDKKTEKYTDRSYGNDEIVRQIISIILINNN